MNAARPDPDKLLALIGNDQGTAESGRGHLKIFFGASAGVGKTYTMLSEARRLLKDGRDVMIGVVEHHGRVETKALAEGIPILPPVDIDHRGVALKEFDLDAALARRPSLILIDEFAHTNAPGSRHPKRWRDVEELLDNGIDVFTTLNVQHLESVNDQVARLTGVWVRETVPDRVFDGADDIALIDIPSDELLRRLSEGKVYVAEGAQQRAADNFFKKNNLGALRELALRRTAERVDAQNDQLNAAMGRDEAALSEKILVLVGHDVLSARLLRHARRMAGRARAPWTALYLQTDRHEILGEACRRRVEHNLRLAEKMGAQVVRLPGSHAATQIVSYARKNGFTRVLVGHRRRPWWQAWSGKSLLQKLVEQAGGIEISTLSEGDATSEPREAGRLRAYVNQPLSYLFAFGIICVVTAIGLPVRSLATADTLALLYLTAVVIIAARYGIGPSLFATAVSVAAFNWFYTQPYYTFSFYDLHFYFTFAFMAATSLIVGSLTARLSLHARVARKSEQETRLLYDLSRGLASVRGVDAMTEVVARSLTPAFEAEILLWLCQDTGLQRYPTQTETPDPKEAGAVQWVAHNGQIAGRDTDTLPSARGLYLPLQAGDDILGVLGLVPHGTHEFNGADILIFETATSLIASALQRAQRADDAERAHVDTENEKLRNVLLASLSHDLRTPLTVMTNSLSTILRQRKTLPRGVVDEMTSLWFQLARLQKFVGNLLNMAAITSGRLKLNFEPYLVPEIVGAAVARVEPQRGARHIRTRLDGQIPMVWIDGALIEQVLINLLENAFHHTADNGVIVISVERDADRVRVRVSDNGEGLPPGEEAQIFDIFHTHGGEKSDRSHGGSGLGLAICKGIIQAHGGLIYAKTNPAREGGGASFIFTLPAMKEETSA